MAKGTCNILFLQHKNIQSLQNRYFSLPESLETIDCTVEQLNRVRIAVVDAQRAKVDTLLSKNLDIKNQKMLCGDSTVKVIIDLIPAEILRLPLRLLMLKADSVNVNLF